MNKFVSYAIGVAILSCVSLINAQQSESTAAADPSQQSDQNSDLQKLLKAYAPSSSTEQATEKKGGAQNQPQQTQAPQAASNKQQTMPRSQVQPQPPSKPYKSLHDKSIWHRMEVPPRDINKEMPLQDNTEPAEINNQPIQPQNNQQNTAQTTNNQQKSQTQQTQAPSHYNIFQ